MKSFRIYLFFFILLGYRGASCQEIQRTLISGEFNTSTLEQFARQVELKVNCYFYMEPALPDSFKINVTVIGKTLLETLDLAFKNSRINYSIDQEGHVFLTKDRKVETSLPRAGVHLSLDFVQGHSIEPLGCSVIKLNVVARIELRAVSTIIC